MSERFGFTAAQTQQITQDLRDKYKAITYNRSDSQYLKEEHREQAPAVLAQAMKNLGVRWPLDYRLHSKAFNDGNVTAHHGIIPQEADIPVSAMEPDEAKVYTAICERYAVQFLPPAVYDVSESTVSVDGGTLKLTAKRLSDAGKPHPCRYLLFNHGRGDHPARTLYGGHPHHRHGIHREVRQRPGNPGNP